MSATNDTFHVYRDDAREWRWKRIAPNGRETADSGEGYEHKTDAVDAAHREGGDGAKVVVEDDE